MPSPIRVIVVLALALATAACGGRADSAPLPADAGPQAFENSIGMALARIPAGSYLRGAAPNEVGSHANEGPRRRIRISDDFYLGAHEVTVAQFARFTEETGYRTDAERDAAGGFGIDFTSGLVQQQSGITWRDPGFPGFVPGDDHPVVLISWQDAERFCAWLSKREGRTYRLPTEAEWEYAARAGASTAYAFGDDPQALAQHANVADASLSRALPAVDFAEDFDDGHAFLAPVASYPANAFGLYDMHGNVWEWCSDWFQSDAYVSATAKDPQGPAQGRFRAIRGGGWFNPAAQNRAAQRVYFEPRFRYCLLSGFRVVLETR